MNSYTTSRVVLLTALTLSLLNCGVEAGNPSTKKPKGTVTMYVLQPNGATGESLTLPLESVFLISNTDDTIEKVSTSSTELNLLSNPQGSAVDQGQSESDPSSIFNFANADVSAGAYAGVELQLPTDRHPQYQPVGGPAEQLDISELSERKIFIAEKFEVSEGKTTEVILRLDGLGSIASSTDGRKKLKPRGGAFGRPKGFRYNGATEVAGARWICAYAFGIKPPPAPGHHDDQIPLRSNFALTTTNNMNNDNLPPRHPPGTMAAPHVIFTDRQSILFDTDSNCSSAFAKASIVSSKFVLDYLRPGSYALRVFTETGEFVDISETLEIIPPARPEMIQ